MCTHIISSLHAQIAFISLKSTPVTKQLVLPGEPSKMGFEWPRLLAPLSLPPTLCVSVCLTLSHYFSSAVLRRERLTSFRSAFECAKLTPASTDCDYAEAVEMHKSLQFMCMHTKRFNASWRGNMRHRTACAALSHVMRHMWFAIILPPFFHTFVTAGKLPHFQKQYGLRSASTKCNYALYYAVCTATCFPVAQ